MICSVDPGARIGWRYPGAQTDAPLPSKFALRLVCAYRRRLRDPMVQSFVMIVTSSPCRQLQLERPKYGNSHSRPTTAWLGSKNGHDSGISSEGQLPDALDLASLPPCQPAGQPCRSGLEASHATTDVGGANGLGGRLALWPE